VKPARYSKLSLPVEQLATRRHRLVPPDVQWPGDQGFAF
jgi:hypothetical protein